MIGCGGGALENDFDTYAPEYDSWYDRHQNLFLLEIKALRKALDLSGETIEIGVGTGRVAKELGITVGVEPSRAMAAIAQVRGISVIEAHAESLPFAPESYNCVLFATTICFVSDLERTLQESKRILSPNGSIVIGFIDKDSHVGKQYENEKNDSRFCHHAHLYTAREVETALMNAGFLKLVFYQTLFTLSDDHVQDVKEGYGEGGYVVVRGRKPGNT
mgnify:FL=1